MAIIRKGDKEAEAGLKKRAYKQARERAGMNDAKRKKAGMDISGKRVSNKTGTPKVQRLTVTEKNQVVNRKADGAVSGHAITKQKIMLIKDKTKRDAAYKKFTGQD